ncbi:MAG: hypothetical protein ABH863_00450 [Candidatus Micrarchaeota archaeon]
MPILSTNVDKLMDFINLRHGCTIEDASRALSQPYKKVEQIAETLSKSGLIEIKYGFTGTRLIPKSNGFASLAHNGNGIKKELVAPTIERIEAIDKELAQAKKIMEFSEREIKAKISRAKNHFELLREEDISYEVARIGMGRMRNLEFSIRVLEEKADSLGKTAFEIRQHMGGLEGMLEIKTSNGERGSPSPKVLSRIFGMR